MCCARPSCASGWIGWRNGPQISTAHGSRDTTCRIMGVVARARSKRCGTRSEEHTSELQSRLHLVCRLLLEKKKNKKYPLLGSKKKKHTLQRNRCNCVFQIGTA